MNSPRLFPKTLLDIRVNSDTVVDLYRNCGLPPSLGDKLFSDLPPEVLAELVAVTQLGLQGAHEGEAKLSDLSSVIRYILFYLLTKDDPK